MDWCARWRRICQDSSAPCGICAPPWRDGNDRRLDRIPFQMTPAPRIWCCCPSLNVAPPSWRLFAGWKPALHPKLGHHPELEQLVTQAQMSYNVGDHANCLHHLRTSEVFWPWVSGRNMGLGPMGRVGSSNRRHFVPTSAATDPRHSFQPARPNQKPNPAGTPESCGPACSRG